LGIIKGLGIQYSAQNQAIICFLFISLPSAYLLAFKGGYGVNGLWIGYGIGLAFLSISYLITLSSADWDKISIEV
jgi:MATE family multidrug resistance protein